VDIETRQRGTPHPEKAPSSAKEARRNLKGLDGLTRARFERATCGLERPPGLEDCTTL
jgi:hypothetical protein